MDQHGLNIICIQVFSHIVALIATFKCFLYHSYHLFGHLGLKLVVELICFPLKDILSWMNSESLLLHRLSLSKNYNTEPSSVLQIYDASSHLPSNPLLSWSDILSPLLTSPGKLLLILQCQICVLGVSSLLSKC